MSDCRDELTELVEAERAAAQFLDRVDRADDPHIGQLRGPAGQLHVDLLRLIFPPLIE